MRTLRLDRDAALALTPVSRETEAKLEIFLAELARWAAVKNLIARGTLEIAWTRHIADSLQLMALCPQARIWVDLGSGAGFPGLVLAIALAAVPGTEVHLIESNARKCAFLRSAVRLTGAPAVVHEARIEDRIGLFRGKADVVTARALAPLSKLLAWTEPLLTTGTIALFPKGRDAEAELTAAANSWKFAADLIPSVTDSAARIVRISALERR